MTRRKRKRSNGRQCYGLGRTFKPREMWVRSMSIAPFEFPSPRNGRYRNTGRLLRAISIRPHPRQSNGGRSIRRITGKIEAFGDSRDPIYGPPRILWRVARSQRRTPSPTRSFRRMFAEHGNAPRGIASASLAESIGDTTSSPCSIACTSGQ